MASSWGEANDAPSPGTHPPRQSFRASPIESLLDMYAQIQHHSPRQQQLHQLQASQQDLCDFGCSSKPSEKPSEKLLYDHSLNSDASPSVSTSSCPVAVNHRMSNEDRMGHGRTTDEGDCSVDQSRSLQDIGEDVSSNTDWNLTCAHTTSLAKVPENSELTEYETIGQTECFDKPNQVEGSQPYANDESVQSKQFQSKRLTNDSDLIECYSDKTIGMMSVEDQTKASNSVERSRSQAQRGIKNTSVLKGGFCLHESLNYERNYTNKPLQTPSEVICTDNTASNCHLLGESTSARGLERLPAPPGSYIEDVSPQFDYDLQSLNSKHSTGSVNLESSSSNYGTPIHNQPMQGNAQHLCHSPLTGYHIDSSPRAGFLLDPSYYRPQVTQLHPSEDEYSYFGRRPSLCRSPGMQFHNPTQSFDVDSHGCRWPLRHPVRPDMSWSPSDRTSFLQLARLSPASYEATGQRSHSLRPTESRRSESRTPDLETERLYSRQAGASSSAGDPYGPRYSPGNSAMKELERISQTKTGVPGEFPVTPNHPINVGLVRDRNNSEKLGNNGNFTSTPENILHSSKRLGPGYGQGSMRYSQTPSQKSGRNMPAQGNQTMSENDYLVSAQGNRQGLRELDPRTMNIPPAPNKNDNSQIADFVHSHGYGTRQRKQARYGDQSLMVAQQVPVQNMNYQEMCTNNYGHGHGHNLGVRCINQNGRICDNALYDAKKCDIPKPTEVTTETGTKENVARSNEGVSFRQDSLVRRGSESFKSGGLGAYGSTDNAVSLPPKKLETYIDQPSQKEASECIEVKNNVGTELHGIEMDRLSTRAESTNQIHIKKRYQKNLRQPLSVESPVDLKATRPNIVMGKAKDVRCSSGIPRADSDPIGEMNPKPPSICKNAASTEIDAPANRDLLAKQSTDTLKSSKTVMPKLGPSTTIGSSSAAEIDFDSEDYTDLVFSLGDGFRIRPGARNAFAKQDDMEDASNFPVSMDSIKKSMMTSENRTISVSPQSNESKVSFTRGPIPLQDGSPVKYKLRNSYAKALDDLNFGNETSNIAESLFNPGTYIRTEAPANKKKLKLKNLGRRVWPRIPAFRSHPRRLKTSGASLRSLRSLISKLSWRSQSKRSLTDFSREPTQLDETEVEEMADASFRQPNLSPTFNGVVNDIYESAFSAESSPQQRRTKQDFCNAVQNAKALSMDNVRCGTKTEQPSRCSINIDRAVTVDAHNIRGNSAFKAVKEDLRHCFKKHLNLTNIAHRMKAKFVSGG